MRTPESDPLWFPQTERADSKSEPEPFASDDRTRKPAPVLTEARSKPQPEPVDFVSSDHRTKLTPQVVNDRPPVDSNGRPVRQPGEAEIDWRRRWRRYQTDQQNADNIRNGRRRLMTASEHRALQEERERSGSWKPDLNVSGDRP